MENLSTANDIEKRYSESLKTLEELCKIAIELSNATSGRTVDSWQKEYGSHIFGNICMKIVSILKLLPKSSFYQTVNNVEFWDMSSVCILTRSLIEAYNVFYYLSIDETDKDGLEFRYLFWNLSEDCERLNMLEQINSKNTEVSRRNMEEFKEKIKNNEFYKKCDKKIFNERKKYGIFLTNNQISEKAGIINYYKSTYKYLSNYVHICPLSISQIAAFKANDAESIGILTTVINEATAYFCLCIRDFVKLFPDQVDKLNPQVAETIETWEYSIKECEKEYNKKCNKLESLSPTNLMTK